MALDRFGFEGYAANVRVGCAKRFQGKATMVANASGSTGPDTVNA